MSGVDPKLTVKKRDRAGTGKPWIAPFINGWNVWDIPPEHWVNEVQQAILHAYELGWKDCNEQHNKIGNHDFSVGAKFVEE